MKDLNILHFYNLQQLDGYNPLVLKGIRFKLKDLSGIKELLKDIVTPKDIKEFKAILGHDFTPGELAMQVEKLQIKLNVDFKEFLSIILDASEIGRAHV